MRSSRAANAAGVALILMLVLPGSVPAVDRPEIEFDGRDWRLRFEVNLGGERYAEFVLDEDSLFCWCERVTWQYFEAWQGRASASEIMRQLRHRRMMQMPAVQWQVLSQGFDSVLYVWQIENHRTIRDHFELVRIIKSHGGLHVLRYAAKDRDIFSEHLDSFVESFERIEIFD